MSQVEEVANELCFLPEWTHDSLHTIQVETSAEAAIGAMRWCRRRGGFANNRLIEGVTVVKRPEQAIVYVVASHYVP